MLGVEIDLITIEGLRQFRQLQQFAPKIKYVEIDLITIEGLRRQYGKLQAHQD